jgi:hypothetical protein
VNLEDLGVLLEDLVNAERRKAVALEELVQLAQVTVDAFVMSEQDSKDVETTEGYGW